MNCLTAAALVALLASLTASACVRALSTARTRLEASVALHEARAVLLLVSMESPEIAAAVEPAWEGLMR